MVQQSCISWNKYVCPYRTLPQRLWLNFKATTSSSFFHASPQWMNGSDMWFDQQNQPYDIVHWWQMINFLASYNNPRERKTTQQPALSTMWHHNQNNWDNYSDWTLTREFATRYTSTNTIKKYSKEANILTTSKKTYTTASLPHQSYIRHVQ